jgi:hypothetical protein
VVCNDTKRLIMNILREWWEAEWNLKQSEINLRWQEENALRLFGMSIQEIKAENRRRWKGESK